MDLLPSPGTRLRLSGNLGTVRYVGNVDNTKGIWLGVEWDDPQRGKHDGVKDGKRYFTCRVPNAGSFIRPSTSISYGTSFLRALLSKYVEVPHGTISQEKVVLGSSKGAIEVEAVGLDKIRGKFANLDRLREASLDKEDVATCDKSGEISKTCPNLRGLDLSTSLIPSWDILALIVVELPHIERLSLNRNRFSPLTDVKLASSAFSKLSEMQLNGTMMTFREFQEIAVYIPNLQVIELGYNRLAVLSTLEASVSVESHVRSINLDGNKCNDWPHICLALKQYPVLQRLILTSNHIENIPPLTDTQVALLGLKILSLSCNRLNSWDAIDALSCWCPGLETLSLNGNPLVEGSESRRYSRQFTVAKIPSLLTLDGSLISRKERSDCELFYLSYIARQGPSSEEEKCREHPRWKDLCLKHGMSTSTPHRKEHSNNLSNRLIQLDLRQCLTPPSPGQDPCPAPSSPVALRVLPSMSLRIFRQKVFKSLKSTLRHSSSSGFVNLWLRMDDGTFTRLHHDLDDKDLSWLGVENGSELLFCVQ